MEGFLQNNELTYERNSYYTKNTFLHAAADMSKPVTYDEVRDKLPQPIFDGHDSYLACYDYAWQVAFSNLSSPVEGAGFVSPFIDINNATLENLLPGKEYVYRIVNGEYVSQTYSFKTSASDEFNFLFASDAQIGASYDVSTDAENWENSLNNALAMFPNTTLLIHAGDQVDVPDNEEQYAGYLQPAALSSLASATVVGNHDEYKGNYGEHFNNPNTTTDGEVYISEKSPFARRSVHCTGFPDSAPASGSNG